MKAHLLNAPSLEDANKNGPTSDISLSNERRDNLIQGAVALIFLWVPKILTEERLEPPFCFSSRLNFLIRAI